ncbi:hypothetical protein H6P81_013130 [Aristolochia fimbriata]|uniref:Uncharacterized protein n=1 Tax=Aristolochia fimbriata TaxID=158543 RepID=A0AAV7EH25_ARIFI|nr:hypothetical protein H6P81_013130 [Aristolochia fimbriata]
MAFSGVLFVKRFIMALLLIVLVTFSVSVVEKVSADDVKCIAECDGANHECTASCIEKGFFQGECVAAGFKVLCCCR